MACVKQREMEDKGGKDASDAWCDIKVPTHFDSDLNNSNQDKINETVFPEDYILNNNTVLNQTLFQDNQEKVTWGTADTYKPKDGSKHILYSQDFNYAFRGIALEQLSLLE